MTGADPTGRVCLSKKKKEKESVLHADQISMLAVAQIVALLPFTSHICRSTSKL